MREKATTSPEMGYIEQRSGKSAPFWGAGSLRVTLAEAKNYRFQTYEVDRAPSRCGDLYFMQRLDVEDMDGEIGAWRDLAARALEPNAFFEPGFALSLARHSLPRSRPRFVAVWRRDGVAAQRLVGLFPMARTRPWLGGGLAAIWLDRQAACAAPLVDRDCAEEVLARFLEWVGETQRVSGVLFPRLVEGSPLHRAIVAAAGAGVRTLERFERAALLKDSDRDELCRRGASNKALKDLRRRARRLGEEGDVAFAITSTPSETRAAAEQFLILEGSGWKRKSGFLSHPALTAFFRSATRLLAREGKCRIASLTLDGRPLAMGVVLQTGDRAFFWKIAYDEACHARAPGIHLVYELTAALAAQEDVALTDSCAIANHPMIDRFWPDRISICDVAAPLPQAPIARFDAACRLELLRRRLRARVKAWAKGLLGRRES